MHKLTLSGNRFEHLYARTRVVEEGKVCGDILTTDGAIIPFKTFRVFDGGKERLQKCPNQRDRPHCKLVIN